MSKEPKPEFRKERFTWNEQDLVWPDDKAKTEPPSDERRPVPEKQDEQS